MGESIDGKEYSEENLEAFKERLRDETKILMTMLEGREFEYQQVPKIGLEVEAWLVNKDGSPTPQNKEFLKKCGNDNIVEELAQFNFEMNTNPVGLKDNCFSSFQSQLENTWTEALDCADAMGISSSLVGIHPLITASHLTPEYISEGGRYTALCERILALRDGKPISIDIQGDSHYSNQLGHVMMESAATSIQVHIQANQENFCRLFNASLLASTPTVAVAANSPFFDGHALWDETRIPLFEQAVRVASFRDKRGNEVGRVTFGTGYTKRSAIELYLENLNAYPPLIPILFEEPAEKLHHLMFHNGTLWRWNRPIVAFNKGEPHLRIEQRVMASGPTITDIVANTAFAVGLTLYLARLQKPPEESVTFTDCKANFYSACKYGLNAKVRWLGKSRVLRSLLMDELIPQSIEGLKDAGVYSDDVSYYLENIMLSRVKAGQNGSEWQKAFVGSHGPDFHAMAKAYHDNVISGAPVHTWKL